MQKQVRCPKCKTQQPVGVKCVKCGLDFREYARKLKEKRAAQGSAPKHIRCPECRKVQSLGEKCVDCGLDFKEYARRKKEERSAQAEGKPAPETPQKEPENKAEEKTAATKRRGPKNYRDEKPVDIKVPVLEREPELSTIGELLGNTWIIFKTRFGILIGLYLVSMVMTAVPMSATFGAGFMTAITWPGAVILMAVVSMLGVLIGILAWTWGFGAFISAACDEMQGFREAMGSGWRNMWSLFWLYLLIFAVIQGGFFLLVLPGLVWTVSLFAAPFVLFEERQTGLTAVLKSRSYVKGHWWAVFIRLLVIIIIMMIVSIVPFGGVLFTPFMMIYLVLLYRELKAMKGKDWRFSPSGGAKAAFGAVALIGVLLPLALIAGGVFMAIKHGFNVTALQSLAMNGFMESQVQGEPSTSLAPTLFEGDIEPELRLEKTAFVTGERITVHFKAPATYPQNAWVGIIPYTVPHGSEQENDRHDVSYFYIKGRTSGEFVFAAPMTPGIYDVRMHDTDDDGVEVASVTFAVESGTSQQVLIPQSAEPSISTLKSNYVAGEPIEVEYSGLPGNAQDWITMVKASAPDDTFGTGWFYTEGRSSGKHVFKGVRPGEYEVRVYFDWPNGGYEVQVRYPIKIGEK